MSYKLVIKCPVLNEVNSFDPADLDDDIMGSDPLVKTLYWASMTLEDMTEVSSELQDILEAWLKMDGSKYMSMSLPKIGVVEFIKRKIV